MGLVLHLDEQEGPVLFLCEDCKRTLVRDVEEATQGCDECLLPRHLGRSALQLALLKKAHSS